MQLEQQLDNVVAIQGFAGILVKQNGQLHIACTYTKSLTNAVQGVTARGLIPFFGFLDDVHDYIAFLAQTNGEKYVEELFDGIQDMNISSSRVVKAYLNSIEPFTYEANNDADKECNIHTTLTVSEISSTNSDCDEYFFNNFV